MLCYTQGCDNPRGLRANFNHYHIKGSQSVWKTRLGCGHCCSTFAAWSDLLQHLSRAHLVEACPLEPAHVFYAEETAGGSLCRIGCATCLSFIRDFPRGISDVVAHEIVAHGALLFATVAIAWAPPPMPDTGSAQGSLEDRAAVSESQPVLADGEREEAKTRATQAEEDGQCWENECETVIELRSTPDERMHTLVAEYRDKAKEYCQEVYNLQRALRTREAQFETELESMEGRFYGQVLEEIAARDELEKRMQSILASAAEKEQAERKRREKVEVEMRQAFASKAAAYHEQLVVQRRTMKEEEMRAVKRAQLEAEAAVVQRKKQQKALIKIKNKSIKTLSMRLQQAQQELIRMSEKTMGAGESEKERTCNLEAGAAQAEVKAGLDKRTL
jgi:hypothetical protein